MGEAERSIAVKRRAVVPSSSDYREDSPSEVYTPKKKKSSSGAEVSPPPYIPSRKDRTSKDLPATSSGTSSSQCGSSRQERLDHTKQSLSSRDRKDLISRSRRMELFKHIGIDRKEEVPGVRIRETRRKSSDGSTSRNNGVGGGVGSTGLSTTTREVSRKRSNDGVRDLKIMARLGPEKVEEKVVSGKGKGLDLRQKVMRSTYSKDDRLQIIINPTASPALKGSVASRLGKVVVKRPGSCDDENDENDEDGGEVKKIGDKNKKEKVGNIGRLAVSRHAKNLVDKQCREAVLSVRVRDQGGSGLGRHLARGDSRKVEAETVVIDQEDDDGDDDDEEEEEEKDEVVVKRIVTNEESLESGVDVLDKKNDDDEEGGEEKTSVRVGGKDEGEELDDLAEMISGENLEPELLKDNTQDELNLDLEVEDNDDDDIEKMIGVKSEEEKPKPGTRFIVTLDGIDERQFDGESERKSDSASSLLPQPAVVKAVPKLSPLLPYHHPPHQQRLQPPALPPQPTGGVIHILQPPVIGGGHVITSPPAPHGPPHGPPVYNLGGGGGVGDPPHPLPPPSVLSIVPPRESVKPLPPKIQPFSINLKDSDDEIEDKTSLTTLTALQKAKMSERCKFWPACAAGSECEFHHPTSYCKTFPNCKFADKCLFIHPNCKFDSKCTRPDCPFTHTSRRPGFGSSAMSAPHPIPKPPPPPTVNTMCRFFPSCTNPACPFLHPKPCRFGLACQNAGCLFYHPPPIPTKQQLKWKAAAHPHTATTTTQHKESTQPPQSSVKLPVIDQLDPSAKFRQPVAKVSPMSSSTNN